MSPAQLQTLADLERAHGPAHIRYSRRHVVAVWTTTAGGAPIREPLVRLIGPDARTIPLERR